MNTIEGLTLRWEPWTGASLLAHLWQSSLVAAAVLVILGAARRTSARTRWAIGWIGLAKFALPVAWFAPALSRLEPLTRIAWIRLPSALAAASARGTGGAAALPGVRLSWAGAGLGLWALVALALMASWWLRGHRFRRALLAAAVPVPAALAARIARAGARAGLARPPRCAVVPTGSGPGILGVLCPVVVLPLSLGASLSGPEIDAVLLHEFTHLRRHDALACGIQALLVRILWFHPLVWALDRRLRVEMEKSCDEEVLDMTSDAPAYAAGILKVVRHSLGAGAPGFAGAAELSVAARVRAILARGASPHLRQPRALALAAAASVAVLSGFSAASRGETDPGSAPGRILVVRDPGAADRSLEFEAALGNLGYSFAERTPADLPAADLSAFRLIVITANDWTTSFSTGFARTAERFDRFALDGGALPAASAGESRWPSARPALDPRAAHLVFLNATLWRN